LFDYNDPSPGILCSVTCRSIREVRCGTYVGRVFFNSIRGLRSIYWPPYRWYY
ncbi:hypothetical protein B0F90DRAFT_1711274, partial [Multifurca ochricompacta]